ncbi:hypothetical protein JTB14_009177 [Gonioctena quinquepunctata]|nr:hypothetical protein JTB14_009177 [Gonioctena quinquepunctata]
MIADVCTASTSSDGGNSMEVPPKEIVCYRCNKPGHRAIGCMVRLPKLLEAGKRQPTLLNDRVRGVDRECSVDKLQVLLDFVLDHTVGDEHPYLRVEVLGKSLLGLLDSGASRTILGGKGWKVIRELGLQLDGTRTSFCTVANGSQCQGIRAVEMPISLRSRLGLVAAIVVPDLPHLLILGADFWKIMGIVPDLRHNEWHFSNEPVLVNSVEHVSGQTMLTAMEKMRLQAVIDRNMALMGRSLGVRTKQSMLSLQIVNQSNKGTIGKGKENVVPDALSRSVPIIDSLRIDSCSVEDQVLTGTTEDKWYQAMVGKVRNNPLKFALWRESDGRLWKHIVPDYPNLSSPTDSWRLVVPRGDRVGIIVGAHEPPTSGHTGVYKTFARISSRYYWPKMRSDIAKFGRRCVVCASHKVSQDRPTDKMVSHPKFADKHRTLIKFSASYHPRANPTERINRTLKTMLAMYVSDNHCSWDENLDEIACAIRTSRHEVTKLTPYFVNFGRNMVLSGANYGRDDLREIEDGTQTGEGTINEAFRKMFQDVRKRLEVAPEKSCDRYNLRRRQEEYLPNQMVWKRNYVLSDASKYFTRKLAPKYVGPYYIKKRLSPWTYELRDVDGNSKGSWHVKDLKPSLQD